MIRKGFVFIWLMIKHCCRCSWKALIFWWAFFSERFLEKWEFTQRINRNHLPHIKGIAWEKWDALNIGVIDISSNSGSDVSFGKVWWDNWKAEQTFSNVSFVFMMDALLSTIFARYVFVMIMDSVDSFIQMYLGYTFQ